MNLFAEEQTDGKALWTFIQSKLKWLLLTGAIMGVLAGIITSQIPPRYTSTAIFFPPDYQDSATIILNSRLGIELHTNRLIELLRSSRVKDRLAGQFDLYAYYQLNANDQDALYQALDYDLNIDRTAMLSVRVKATTQDPKLSANLANAVTDMTNEIWEAAFKEKGPANTIYVIEKARPILRPIAPSYGRNIGLSVLSSMMILLLLWGIWEKINSEDAKNRK